MEKIINTEKKIILVVTNNLSEMKPMFDGLQEKFLVKIATSAIDALKLVSDGGVCLVIAKQKMTSICGLGFLLELKMHHPNIIRILITAKSDCDICPEKRAKAELFSSIIEPLDEELLLNLVEQGVNIHLKN